METTQIASGSNSVLPTVEQKILNTLQTPSRDLEGRTEKPSKADNTEPVTGIRFTVLLLSLTLASLLVFLDTSVVATAIPKITDEFHSLRDVGCAVFGPLSGRILHHFSLKWCYIVFFAVFELGSVLCGAAQSSGMLILGRVIAGVGAAGISSGAYTVLSAAVPLEKRPAMLGMLMGVAQLGVICGPLVGGAFTTGYTWRWCFYINLPLGALVGVSLALIRIPDQLPKQNPASVFLKLHRHLDLLGFALLAPAIVQLLLALQYGGNQFTWNSSQVIGLFCGAGVTFIVWIFWNYHKADDALLPFSIIMRRPVWMSGTNYAFMMATVFGSTYFLPIYFQAVKGVNAIMSGVYLLAIVLPQLISAVIGGSLVTKVGYVTPFALVGGMLSSELQEYAPGTNAEYIIAAGATRYRSFVSPQDLPGVLRAFSASLDHTFYLQAAAGVVAWCAAWGMGWKEIRKDKETTLNHPAISKLKAHDVNMK
ncbi:hypothetical protein B7463_g9868, partial [Scytalidium lignicola]